MELLKFRNIFSLPVILDKNNSTLSLGEPTFHIIFNENSELSGSRLNWHFLQYKSLLSNNIKTKICKIRTIQILLHSYEDDTPKTIFFCNLHLLFHIKTT